MNVSFPKMDKDATAVKKINHFNSVSRELWYHSQSLMHSSEQHDKIICLSAFTLHVPDLKIRQGRVIKAFMIYLKFHLESIYFMNFSIKNKTTQFSCPTPDMLA